MLGIFIILLFSLYLAFLYPIKKTNRQTEEKDPKFDAQMKKLWNIAQTSMKEKKTVRAEKALLTILKFDEKNAAAYNRLGIIYAKEQNYDEAIECFEIAQSLDNNASCLHNVGLIYLETGAYEKAVMAFQQAIEMEGDVPARFIALAKAQERIGQRKAAIDSLESAYELDHSVSTLRQILAIHEIQEDTEAITATTARIEAQIAENARIKEAKRAAVNQRTATARAARAAAIEKRKKEAEAKKAAINAKKAELAKKKAEQIKLAKEKAVAQRAARTAARNTIKTSAISSTRTRSRVPAKTTTVRAQTRKTATRLPDNTVESDTQLKVKIKTETPKNATTPSIQKIIRPTKPSKKKKII